MPYYLTKVLPLLLMPLSICVLALLVALFLLLAGKRRPSVFCLMAAVIVLWVSSLPAVADKMLWSLESQYKPVPVEQVPPGDCIIVLGGALGVAQAPRVEIELTDAVDRVYQAARLFRLGKGRTIIVTAGNQPWTQKTVPEAVLIKNLLVEWGVPPGAVVLDVNSRTTRENALYGDKLLHLNECHSGLLVTSAWHMPRAMATFRSVGQNLIPVPVDVRFVPSSGGGFSRFIPRADALAATSQALYEWMGIWVYRWKGWN